MIVISYTKCSQVAGLPYSKYKFLEGAVSLCSCPLKTVATNDCNCHVLSMWLAYVSTRVSYQIHAFNVML